ncbi:MAG: NrpR regulatory domain-containing protein [Nitrososphaerota archaeon]|nr:NrpR regulatory domain-containing protein [Candidatus Bathyarchaeota archaeon]MDW8022270.1 NrpR regulatory domain-containing protein [Nitrososphaerota archaeon]
MAESAGVSRLEIEILRVLSGSTEPVGSRLLQRELEKRGFFLSERTVRYHLQLLELKGLVAGHERSGRTITTQGLEELSRALVSQRVGFVITRFLSMACSVTYDYIAGSGMVVANVSIVDKSFYDKMFEIVRDLQASNLLLAPYIKVLDEDEEYQNIVVPKGNIGLLTICDLTVDGVLIRSGIPLYFKYGGLVQMVNGKPLRFVDMISYEGTTVSPLELFVRSNQTSVLKIVKTGSGVLPVGMREIVAEARERTHKIVSTLKDRGWGGVLVLGVPNEPVLGVPVSMDRFGLCMVGGIALAAALLEGGAKIETFASYCLVPIEEMKRI